MSRIATLVLGHGVTALCTLARTLLLASLLGLDDYAVAIALSVLLAAVEMMTNLGLPQLYVSHPNGGQHSWQRGLHGFQLLRGLVGAIIVLLLAHPLAQLLNVPDAATLFASGAIVPLVLGWCHLDIYRAQRHRRHLPQVIVLSIPALLSICALFLFEKTINSPNLMLLALSTQAFSTCILSHVLAKRPYRVQFAWTMGPLVLRYGMPVAANGLLLFAVLHFEKLIAGQTLGLPALAFVAMGATLTMTPMLVAARCFQAYHLPRLAHRGLGYDRNLIFKSVLIGMALSVLTYVFSGLVVKHLGPNFADLEPLLSLFVLLAAGRIPKSALATIALASGRTNLPIWANLPRLGAAPLIWLALTHGYGIDTLLYLAITAEVVGLSVGAWLTFGRRRAFAKLEMATAA